MRISTAQINYDSASGLDVKQRIAQKQREWDEGRLVDVNANMLLDWCTSGRLLMKAGDPPRGTIVCTLNPVTIVNGEKMTTMLHNAAAAGNVEVLRVLLR